MTGSNVLTSKGALGEDVLKGGRGALIKAPVGLQDLKERIAVQQT
jgi:hypothetical protein